MRNQDECTLLRDIRKELVGIAIGKVQNMQTTSSGDKLLEPEISSPKILYEVEEMLNNPYMNRDEVPLAMDIFKPVVPEETEMPAIVVIHGGGLVIGDRKFSRLYGKALASRGYLVFSIEYRLAPRANACEQLDDVCAGLDLVGRRLIDFNVDLTRIYMTAGSAGAYLATYVTAMKHSEALQEAIGYEPTRMTFKALGLHCGMFYTDKEDPIGLFLGEQFYGDRVQDENFRQFLNPEHGEILNNLPPVFLTTSKGDFLSNYTLMYYDALKKAGHRAHLLYYGDDTLGHDFVTGNPNRAECIRAIDKMIDWFEFQGKLYDKDLQRRKEEQIRSVQINERIQRGEIIEQKAWQMIKELNSCSKEGLEKTALVDGVKKYSYREMFAMWDGYAAVFSTIGLTGKAGRRVALTGVTSAETIAALYGLNMTGTSVSLVLTSDLEDQDAWENVVKQERITDLILVDCSVTPKLVKRLVNEMDRLGLRNIIILHANMDVNLVSREDRRKAAQGYKKLKEIRGVKFMEELLQEFGNRPISYDTNVNSEAAVIPHTSGTTKGIRKPVPLSDRAMNEGAARLLRDERFRQYRGKTVSALCLDLSSCYSLVDMMHLPLALGGRVHVMPLSMTAEGIVRFMNRSKANVMFATPFVLERLIKAPFRPDLSHVEFLFMGAGYVSKEEKRRYDRYLEDCGTFIRVTVGYGLSEVAGACLLSSSDSGGGIIGKPLSKVKVKIYDEKEQRYYDLEDGPRTGDLLITTPSLSSGKLDDTVFFELTDIDGELYFDTHDLVDVNGDGSLSYVERTN